MITYDSLFKGEPTKTDDELQKIADRIDVQEIREHLLGSIIESDARAMALKEVTEEAFTFMHERCISYAVIARRGSDEVLRKLSNIIITKCNIFPTSHTQANISGRAYSFIFFMNHPYSFIFCSIFITYHSAFIFRSIIN